MPRGMTSRGARAERNGTTPTTTTGDTETVTTDTMTTTDEETTMRDDLPFTVDISAAEEGFKPDRSPAGRRRLPSPFEPVLPELKGKGWQNQPHDGAVIVGENGKVEIPGGVKGSNAAVILRELSKAVKYLNSDDGGELNLGLDVNVTADLVQFNVRDKQNRKARTPQGDESTDGESNDDSDDDTSGDE